MSIRELPPPVAQAGRILQRTGAVELAVVVTAYFFYQIVRSTTAGDAHVARDNAIDLVSVERTLGLFWEAQIQDLVVSSELLIRVFNGFYTYGHFPLIFAVGLWLFVFQREQYSLTRNAFLISGAISLVFFHLYPLAPPRLFPMTWGFEDTLGQFSSVNYHSAGAFVNQYAAMPSLHIGWNLLLAIAIVNSVRNQVVQVAAAAMPVLMSITVVVTGNHFFLDIAGGLVVAVIGLALARQWSRHSWRLRALIEGQEQAAKPLV